MVFTTGASVSDNLYIGARYTADGTIQASVDNFRLDATSIPEPSTYALMFGAAAALMIIRRRSK